ncbi:3'(2'),5'-bisphosphate nucleotidase CysQ family protein [Legionella impletisoli]|uniref:3'(2'),5'-bisphosphate nucleotidase CysQ n=1 Tax=Legionella impletisoli TaxID=343510 RepID=A0A917N8U2_9GAMM|nr:3'(2'),5'-bisphosphate nucleotidase CysQ [Legionella impletisoli]GGI77403.1 3'(2'),5'-bisphosphate nucleotidase CysQ [Legionella impletisoli]
MKEFISSSYPVELQSAIELAYEAGEIALHVQKKGYQVWNKGAEANNPVTEADKAISEHVVLRLKELFPHDLIISEEAPLPTTVDDEQRIWFVDPIDGTKEFIKGLNEWSVMIGLSEQGKSVVGVVYQPITQVLYYATKEGGSFYSSQNQVFKNQVRTLPTIKEAVLIQSRSHWSLKAKAIAEQFGITRSIQHGSIGLKFGLIARGHADLYMNFSGHCHLWDLCAPEIILTEAAGVVSSTSGNALNFHSVNTLVNHGFWAASASVAHEVFPYLNKD